MPAGESRRLQYKPGVERPRPTPPEPGDYQLTLVKPKLGLTSWKAGKAGKFPSKRLEFQVIGTEDEASGEEKKLSEFASASPKAFFRVYDLAAACGYPEEIDLPEPKKPTDASVREVCNAIDDILKYIADNNIVMNGHIEHEEYKGQPQGRITNWLPPGEAEATETDESETEEEETEEAEAEETEEAEADEEETDEEPEEEEEKPAKKKVAAKPAAKPVAKKTKR